SAHEIVTTSVTLSGPIMPIAAKGTIANNVAVIAIPKTIALGNFLISSLLLEYPRVNSGTIYCARNEKTTKLKTGIEYFILAKKINSDLISEPIIKIKSNSKQRQIIHTITNIATKKRITTVTTIPDTQKTLRQRQITPAT